MKTTSGSLVIIKPPIEEPKLKTVSERLFFLKQLWVRNDMASHIGVLVFVVFFL